MRNTRQLVRSLFLTGLMLGLGVMGVLRHHHGHPASHLAASHHPLPIHSHGGRGNAHSSRRAGHGTSVGDHADGVSHHHQAGGDGPHPVMVMLAAPAPVLQFGAAEVVKPVASENELAYGGAPRAPGTTRGPPSLS